MSLNSDSVIEVTRLWEFKDLQEAADMSEVGERQPFTGAGNRLDGKKKGVDPNPALINPEDIKRGIPNYEFKIGKITFIRNSRPHPKQIEEDSGTSRFIAFSGEGQSLRKKGRKP